MALRYASSAGYDTLTGEVKAWDYKEELNIEIMKSMKILVATEKPFAKKAVEGIREIVEEAGGELALLEKYTDKAQLLEAVAEADALIVRSDKVTAEVIAAARRLRIVVRAGAGYDNVDLAAASERGIVVMNTPGQNSNAVAELAVALMIFMSRNRFTPGTGSEIQGKTLGIRLRQMWAVCGRKGQGAGDECRCLRPVPLRSGGLRRRLRRVRFVENFRLRSFRCIFPRRPRPRARSATTC